MSTVYVVTQWFYDGIEVIAVYTSEDAANQHRYAIIEAGQGGAFPELHRHELKDAFTILED